MIEIILLSKSPDKFATTMTFLICRLRKPITPIPIHSSPNILKYGIK